MDHEQVTYLIGYNLVWREWRASEARVLVLCHFMYGYDGRLICFGCNSTGHCAVDKTRP